MKPIGQKVKKYRKAKGLSLRALEKACGVSNSYICQVETGKITNVGIETIIKLSNILGDGFIGEVLDKNLSELTQTKKPYSCETCNGTGFIWR